jgi:hypothetical protein
MYVLLVTSSKQREAVFILVSSSKSHKCNWAHDFARSTV